MVAWTARCSVKLLISWHTFLLPDAISVLLTDSSQVFGLARLYLQMSRMELHSMIPAGI